MEKTKARTEATPLTVTLDGAKQLFQCGRGTVEELAEITNASFFVGRRKFYIVDRLNEACRILAEGNQD